jgi:hypothetical protein
VVFAGYFLKILCGTGLAEVTGAGLKKNKA